MNQQNKSENDQPATLLTDLQLTDKQAEVTKAGRESRAPSVSEIVVTKNTDTSSSNLW